MSDEKVYGVAVASGRGRIGAADVAVHVLAGGLAVIEVTEIETLLGLPAGPIGAFLTTLPGGGGRLRFLGPSGPTWGLPTDNVIDLLSEYRAKHGDEPAGEKAAALLREMVMIGLRKMGHDPRAADVLMAITKGSRR